MFRCFGWDGVNMYSSNRERLKKRAQSFQEELFRIGIKSEVDKIGDYQLRLSLAGEKPLGYCILYYRPSEDLFSLKTEGIADSRLETEIGLIWDGIYHHSGCILFVDGSYIRGQIGYGYLVIIAGQLVKSESGAVNDPEATSSHQVGGELKAVVEALKWCQSQGIDAVTIYYDLENTARWARGEYRAKMPLTKNFKNFIDDCEIDIDWHHVSGHSGCYWNDRVDKLARQGALEQDEDPDQGEPLLKLEERALEFRDFLQARGFNASWKGIYNQQCAKLKLEQEEQKIGYFNLYHTRRYPLSPRFHEIRGQEWQQRMQELWQEFSRQRSGEL